MTDRYRPRLCRAVYATGLAFTCIESTATGGGTLRVGYPELNYQTGSIWGKYSAAGELTELTLSNAQMSVQGLAGIWPSESDPARTRSLFEYGVGVMHALEVEALHARGADLLKSAAMKELKAIMIRLTKGEVAMRLGLWTRCSPPAPSSSAS